MQIQESGEMYLETIYVLLQEQGHARAVDIAERMGYSKPSVSRAMGLLRNAAMVEIAADGSITLTHSGTAVAEKIYERHTLLTGLLTSLGVTPATAADDACRMEHAISDESFEAIKRHVQAHTK